MTIIQSQNTLLSWIAFILDFKSDCFFANGSVYRCRGDGITGVIGVWGRLYPSEGPEQPWRLIQMSMYTWACSTSWGVAKDIRESLHNTHDSGL